MSDSLSKLDFSDSHFNNEALSVPEAPNISLLNVIDIEILQHLQDSFARATDVASIIIDAQGSLITKPSNFNGVCELIYKTPKGKKLCDQSNSARDAKVISHGRPSYHQCQSCGFVDASAPIYIGEVHVASWLMGQSNVLGVTREKIARFAGEVGADVDAILQAFDKMPQITVQKFEQILQLLHSIAAEISRLGYQNLKMKNEIASRIRLEQKLKLSESNYQELFNSIMEGIGVVDENEIIRFANPAYAKIFGFTSPDDVINRSLLSFVPEEKHHMILQETGKRKCGKSSQYELPIKTTAGENRTILVSVSPRLDSRGEYRGAFGAVIDITEKKRLEEFTARAQRLETAGRIAAQVAHDFNNLLGPLVAYPELIRSEVPSNSKILPLLDDLEKSAQIMADINQQLLTLGRRGYFKPQVININKMVPCALDSLRESLMGINVRFEPGLELMNIKGGESQIIRVLTNIINNSIDAMSGRGTLIIKTENFYLDRIADMGHNIPKGDYIKITIGDTGGGISDDSLPFVFDPFYTTKTADKKRGSGLGLSVVHAVMEDHNGFVDIESKVGVGTSIFLYFPIARDEVPESERVRIVGGNERILVVDDDRLQRELTLALLGKLGYQAEAVENGNLALNRFNSCRYDLIILDMNMPDGPNGAETYEKMLEIRPGQKAILVSGFAESDVIRKAAGLGAGAFLKKPLTLKSLAIAVRNELDRH